MTPAGRVPGTMIDARVRSLHPIARTMADAWRTRRPYTGEMAVIVLSPVSSSTIASTRQEMPHARTHLIDETLCILWTGQILLEFPKAKTGMDTLVQDSTQEAVAFNDQDVRQTGLVRCNGRGKAGRAASDDDEVVFGLHPTTVSSANIVHTVRRLSQGDGCDRRRRPRDHPSLADDDPGN